MSETTQKIIRKYSHEVLDPNSPTPLYHQLYTMLRDCIIGGVLEDGSKMPSEKELSASFNVSRITARRALHDLATENLVARHRGRGTFVNYRYRPEPLNAPLIGVLESLEHMGRKTKIKVLSLRFSRPPSYILDEFEIDDEQKFCHIIRIRSNKSMPFAYYESWSLRLDKSITKQSLKKHPRLELLRKSGVKIALAEQTLSAEAASPAAADALGVMPGKPLLKLIRRSYDKKGKQLDHLNAVYNPDRFQYQMTLSLDKRNSGKK